ncbi:hypothetical protein [Nocardia wallacei]|uniref:hypothetical protein n=1 Tax=Nocardia wallacei TaxID=480035 RepID=UPI002454CCE0|nr:hypothetical protein [Nocardia wallacei]
MSADAPAERDVLVGRIVIERYLDPAGDRITSTAEDGQGQSLDMVATLGLLEFAKISFTTSPPQPPSR